MNLKFESIIVNASLAKKKREGYAQTEDARITSGILKVGFGLISLFSIAYAVSAFFGMPVENAVASDIWAYCQGDVIAMGTTCEGVPGKLVDTATPIVGGIHKLIIAIPTFCLMWKV